MESLVAWLVQDGRGYPFIFALLLVAGIGVPIPEDVPLIAAGVLSVHGGLGILEASLACLGFILVRDLIVYGLGWRYGMPLLKGRFGQRLVTEEQAERAVALLGRHGAKLVAGGRFAVGLRSAIFFAAGVAKVPPARFLLADGLAALLSVPLWIALGATFAVQLGELAPRLQAARWGLFTVVLLGLALGVLRHRRQASDGR